MPIQSFNHVNIHTAKLEETRSFFEAVVGLEVGDRPNFPVHGYWMYLGDVPIVHLIEIAEGAAPRREPAKGAGVDHIAFISTGRAALVELLDDRGLSYRTAEVPVLRMRQVFVEDPNGVAVEFAFDMEDGAN